VSPSVELDKWVATMAQIRGNGTIYKPPTNRCRGLIDEIGSLAKSLFGTMDAKDKKLIKKQLELLHNKQQTIQHAIQNQLMVLNTTHRAQKMQKAS